jgi:hypothetical protein
MCGGICPTFLKTIEAKPFVIIEFYFVITKRLKESHFHLVAWSTLPLKKA